jgi:hypothetical protein
MLPFITNRDSLQTNSKLGYEKMIPRFAEENLGCILLKYFVYIRPTEEVFARQLWGDMAADTMHHYIFYTHQGKPYSSTTQFSTILQRHSSELLGVALDVSTYRHVAAAIGRYLMVGMIDPEENINTGMDLQAGRTTATSEKIYGLQSGEDGKLNERLMALFLAMSRLWHARVLRQKLDGKVATLAEVLDPTTSDDQLAGNDLPVQGDLAAVVTHLEALFERAVVKNIIPQLVTFYKQQEVDRILAQDRSLMPPNPISNFLSKAPVNQPAVPTYEVPIPSEPALPALDVTPPNAVPLLKSVDKGKQRAAIQEEAVAMESIESDGAQMDPAEAEALAAAIEASLLVSKQRQQTARAAELILHTSKGQHESPPQAQAPVEEVPAIPQPKVLVPATPTPLPLPLSPPTPLDSPTTLNEVQKPDLVHPDDAKKRLQAVLRDPMAQFQYKQSFAFKHLMERQAHVLWVAPTGAGKTLPFQLAMKSWPRKVHGLMVLPYRVLHQDMHRRMREMGLTASEWTPHNPAPASRVITVSIEHFKDKTFLALINTLANDSRLGAIIFDEAHGLMEDATWRRMYLSSLRQVLSYRNVVCHFLSGTMPPSFMHDFWAMIGYKFQPKEAFVELRSCTQRPNHFYQIKSLNLGWRDEGDTAWVQEWLARTVQEINYRIAYLMDEERGLVFLNGEEETRTWADALGCPAITGKTSSEDRNKAYLNWREGKFKVLCANKAGYYGTDYPHVAFSVHVDCPRSLTEWAQSCGRVGRDGSPALCLMLLPRQMGLKKNPQPETFSGTVAIRKLVWMKQCRRIVPSQFLDGVPVTCSSLKQRFEAVAWCDICLLQVKGAQPGDAYIKSPDDDEEEESWGWTEPNGWEEGFDPAPKEEKPVVIAPKLPLKPVQLDVIELVPTSHILDVNQLLRQETTRIAQQVPDIVFKALLLIGRQCLSCLSQGVMTTSHGTVRCPTFREKQQGLKFYAWKKQFFLLSNEEGYCYRCLFNADDERHEHKIGDGLGEHCRFEDVVAPLAWILLWDDAMRKKMAEEMGDPSLGEVENFRKWLLRRLDDNHRQSNACTKLVRWFYNAFKSDDMPCL